MQSGRTYFGSPEWVNADRFNVLSDNFDLDDYHFYRCAAGLDALLRHVDLSEVNRIVDFGSGNGEGLVALDMFASSLQAGGVPIICSEIDESRMANALRVALELPNVQTVMDDGIAAITQNRAARTLTVAMTLGPTWLFPDTEQQVINAAIGDDSDNAHGTTMIFSDESSMAEVCAYADNVLKKRDDVKVYHVPRQNLSQGLFNNGISVMVVQPSGGAIIRQPSDTYAESLHIAA